MKKSIFYLCLLFIAQTAFAADSLYVREQQIPILIDRTDNVLLEMRIPAQKGDVLNNFTLQFGEETNLSDIKPYGYSIAARKHRPGKARTSTR